MTLLTILQFIVNIIIVCFLLGGVITAALLIFKDKRQTQHSVLRNYPLLARIRYFFEKVGPEMRQYFFLEDKEGKPFSRLDYKNIVLAGKYNSRMASFGTEKDYDAGFYIKNTMFPHQASELRIDQSVLISSFIYKIDNERLFERDEHREKSQINPYFLDDEDEIIIGPKLAHPFRLKRLVGQSGMILSSTLISCRL